MGDVVKVTVIATGFDMQPAVEGGQLASARRRSVMPIGAGAPAVAAGVRAAAQQSLARSSSPLGMRNDHRPQADAPRRSYETNREVHVPAERPQRFGAAAIHDEATLDIPAYLRRSRPNG